MEWSTNTKNGYGDLEVYMECGYVSVSSTGRNHVKMAAFSFKYVVEMVQNEPVWPCDSHKYPNIRTC